MQGLAHHERLLLALGGAGVLSICVGLAQAQERLAAEEQRRSAGTSSKPQGAKYGLFRLGLAELQRWLYGTQRRSIRWRLAELDAPSWSEQWQAVQQSKPPAEQLQQAA